MTDTDFEDVIAVWDKAHPDDDNDQHHLLDEIAHPTLVAAAQRLVSQ